MTPRYSAPAAYCAARVLQILRSRNVGLTLANMDRLVDCSKSLLFRVTKELERAGFLDRDSSDRYWLGIEALELGGAYVANLESRAPVSVRTILRQLARELQETVNMGVLRGTDVLYLMKEEGPRSILTISQVGNRLPAHCAAMGKALLAELPGESVDELYAGNDLEQLTPNSIRTVRLLSQELGNIRDQGYALDIEETMRGRGCVAVAVAVPGLSFDRVALSVSADIDTIRRRKEQYIDALWHTKEMLRRESEAVAMIRGQ